MRLLPTDDPQLVLLRHGATEWSQSKRYTGRTDVPLLPSGRAQAVATGQALAEYPFAAVFSSPLQRALHTAQLAGHPNPVVDDDLMEWDYGPAEGLTPPELNALIGHDFEIFTDGVNNLSPQSDPSATGGKVLGEELADVVARCRRFIERVEPILHDGGDVLVVAHGHLLRVLTMVWLDLDPRLASRFELDTTGVSLLGYGHGRHTLEGWNLPLV